MYALPLSHSIITRKHIKIIDSGKAVARQTKAVLEKHDLLNTQTTTSKNTFFTNGNPEILKGILDNRFEVNYLDF